jgi:hypothetical protein
VINLRWSVVAAAAAFVVSLVLGISVRGQALVILIRALGFAAAFFFLAALIWHLINRYIPDLLTRSPIQDPSVMGGEANGSLVNITVGEDPIPQDAALPPEGPSDDMVGNMAEMVNNAYFRRGDRTPPGGAPAPGPDAPPPPAPGPVPSPALTPEPATSAAPTLAAPVPGAPVSTDSRGMDQDPQSGYTQNGNFVSGASAPPLSSGKGSFPASGPEDAFGGVESLPDLDALAGTFLSSDTAGGEEAASSPRPHGGGGGARSKKGKDMGEDFNPKELASAIQTILKRD